MEKYNRKSEEFYFIKEKILKCFVWENNNLHTFYIEFIISLYFKWFEKYYNKYFIIVIDNKITSIKARLSKSDRQ